MQYPKQNTKLFALLLLLNVAFSSASIFSSSDDTSSELPSSTTAVAIRAKRQCGGMGGCCGGMSGCGCGSMGMCGQTCCPSAPPPCTCGTPGCMQCVQQTVLVPVTTTTCCKCCQPVCTNACTNGGGCSCGCTRGGCSRKRRSLLAIASEEMSKRGDVMV
ncbi:hypothetical protein B9Z55_014410 [Caenorhabditis nigoni]|uniref:Uncharacterized protein n=1 Tax=Caenorhabditis nigoni TaxID=1611254 RepID=A0A2G5U6L0_9PELO|nr:hypothetical protein B9Z55_014410 [Caenorhabditis nigoni]